MLLPDQKDSNGVVRHLAVGAGKDSNLYVINRDNMGKYDATSDATIYQQLTGALPNGVWANPAYFDSYVYFGSIHSTLQAFEVRNAQLAAASATTHSFTYPGVTPSISANGSANGIVWAVENSNPAVLHAYNPANLGIEYYNSNQAASGRDHFGAGNKYITTTIANGEVFVGTPNGVAVFATLPSHSLPNGEYKIISQFSTLVLDDPGFSGTSGVQIMQYTPTGGVNQKWFFTANGSGFYTIRNASSGLYLTDPGGSKANGAKLEQQVPNGSDSQLWSLTPLVPGTSSTTKPVAW